MAGNRVADLLMERAKIIGLGKDRHSNTSSGVASLRGFFDDEHDFSHTVLQGSKNTSRHYGFFGIAGGRRLLTTIKDLGEGLGAPGNLMSRLRFLNPDYTVSRYPDAANGVPYEMYDEPTARQKIAAAREIASWAESQIP